MDFKKQFKEGLLTKNPVLVQLLGMCSTLAITTSLFNGIGCGVITILIRYFGGYSEGVTYAILCMNACAVLLDKIGRPVKFGAPKKEAAKK